MTPRIDDIRNDDRYLDALGARRAADDELGELFEPWLAYIDDEPSAADSSRWSRGVGRYARAGATAPSLRRFLVGAGVATAALSVSSVAAAVSGTTVPGLRQLGNVTRALSGETPLPADGPVFRTTRGAFPSERAGVQTSNTDPTDPTSVPPVNADHSSPVMIAPSTTTTATTPASRSHSPLTRSPLPKTPVRLPGSKSPSSPTSTAPSEAPKPTTSSPTPSTTSPTPSTTSPTTPSTTGPTTSSTTTWGPQVTPSPTSTVGGSSPTTSASSSATRGIASSSTTAGSTVATSASQATMTGLTSSAQGEPAPVPTPRELPRPIGSSSPR
ncbi:hypothetical protein [Calidifontibacter terrae]